MTLIVTFNFAGVAPFSRTLGPADFDHVKNCVMGWMVDGGAAVISDVAELPAGCFTDNPDPAGHALACAEWFGFPVHPEPTFDPVAVEAWIAARKE